MYTYFGVLLFFVAFLETTKGNSNGCVSREEFEKFKTDVLTRIDRLSVEKTEQAKQIEDQKRAILNLKSLLAKHDDISSTISHSEEPPMNSTKNVTVDVIDSGTHSPAHLPLKRVSSSNIQKRLISTVPRALGDVIAFYVYLTHPENNPGKHHTIIYDYVVTNYGNGYNKYTGAFIAPRSGVYVFTWTTFANPGSYLPIELIVNNYRYGIISVDGNALYNGVTGVAVVHLNQYDAVLVRSDLHTAPSGNIFSDQNMKTSFSGWCISS